MIQITNEDNMELMARYPDGYFDLAIVDPPYGMINHHQRNKRRKGIKSYSYGSREKMAQWDKAPDPAYFEELFRVSGYQIIFEGNYFNLPPKRNFIIYHKSGVPDGFSMAACEYAWTNITGNAVIFKYHARPDPARFHPTQKPVALYKWLLSKYAKPGWKILDTGTGSGSLAIACIDMGFDLIGCERDKEYYNASMEWIQRHQAQQELFPIPEIIYQEKTLFDGGGDAGC